MARVRQSITDRVHQLETQIQTKLDQAHERKESNKREQMEKLKNHVSFIIEDRIDFFKTKISKTRLDCIFSGETHRDGETEQSQSADQRRAGYQRDRELRLSKISQFLSHHLN